jgi:hypothetical protein
VILTIYFVTLFIRTDTLYGLDSTLFKTINHDFLTMTRDPNLTNLDFSTIDDVAYVLPFVCQSPDSLFNLLVRLPSDQSLIRCAYLTSDHL